ncbi:MULTISPECIES: LacI family DNA-binding transcriptional regulator [unclassified Pseudomonas]|uniref:LacI family DNA-binding transcriptional regulator n=1 Tax=unclassified Pseudomonas TaxID=196821 RepID=UPI000876CC03|nr:MULTISPECIES: LacI family DNA-binding transcriptional regulator [unclassified Pseudomonas]SCZ18613.1 LacI family transcriptional regulator [Pseudomonas sp. NFACC44-2]SDA81500.1 LacI family transcriptional regulator [Pseudomonas sp. NFACC51]SEI39878.1 LacI family transcriptional regulator [Pseudomonas sp. NFACC07-1]SFG98388.1 LacI family transcriptional regulator [Pseudomonas sp. NFACC54]SFS34623.1 LacI family transcriptional regulator [Pseudomonas sp. NFACC48-1]
MSEKPRRMLRPTMADVAREAGVSLSTVDRVLNLRADVRADTAQRIAAAAARLGFHAKGVIEQRVLNDRPTLRLGFLLQKSGVPFYQGLAHALSNAAATCTRARIRVVIGYLDDLDPVIVAQRILALRDQVDGLGVVAVDHPRVREAVAQLRETGVSAVALLSELSSASGTGYVGLDNRLTGRTAGWFISRLASRPGAAAVMLSSQRFQCQELCELSFHSYLAEHSSEWELLASRLTLEDDEFAYGNTLDLLTAEPDLVGLYVAGGGIAGVLRALRSLQKQKIRLPVVVCHDLTPLTREALKTGLVQAVLSHPVVTMAEQAVEALVEAATATSPGSAPRRVVPLQIDVPEST